jgi:hypothetical protein
MIGGFLGAGKTTTIARLARTYQDQGLKVVLVTNDQASDLVDTHALRNQGFDVGEVAGACFCCNFNELTKTVNELGRAARPDVVIAEPVGSCTDLVATVIQPILRLFDEQYTVAPYGVILKPSHGRRILSGQQSAGFSPQAAYIFKKQLEEADFLIINRIDELSLEAEVPGVPIVRTSAKSGAGFETIVQMLDQKGIFGKRILELDYDIYAEGEAELGWLNSSIKVSAVTPFSLDDLLLSIVNDIQQALTARSAETAHLKAIGLSDGAHAVVNLVSNDSSPLLSLASNCHTKSADIVINARVAIDPVELKAIVDAAVAKCSEAVNTTVTFAQTQCFRPGRPVPTHRYADTL